MAEAKRANLYEKLIEKVFCSHYSEGMTRVDFAREDITAAADELGIRLPKNIGDLIYSFRYRYPIPESIRECAPADLEWAIVLVGRGLYAFVAGQPALIAPQANLSRIKIPDSTPGVIEIYALNDEQALLAKLRYNRLIDLFTGVTCYSLQNHLRTAVPGMGQVETDEVYVGIDQRGAHYVFPVQAKGGRDKLSLVQIAQDFAMCESKFASLICRPIAAQFMAGGVIAVFEFERNACEISIRNERHYLLVPTEDLSDEDLKAYKNSAASA